MKGCQRNVEVWQRILKVRALVITPKEDMEMWIKFANLCRKSGRLSLSQKFLTSLLNSTGPDFHADTTHNAPPVLYAYLKHMWATGTKEDAFQKMKDLTKNLVDKLGITHSHDVQLFIDNSKGDANKLAMVKLLARCYLKLGEWQVALHEELNEVS